jgi:hypothetical protein
VSRRTLYLWKKAYQTTGISGLTPVSTAPKHTRKRQWPKAIVDEIKRLREKHPNLGKEKLHPFMTRFCEEHHYALPSVSTLGRLIAGAPDKMRKSPLKLTPQGRIKKYQRSKVTRKPKGYTAKAPGECVALDSIERRLGSLKRYLVTLTDPYSR